MKVFRISFLNLVGLLSLIVVSSCEEYNEPDYDAVNSQTFLRFANSTVNFPVLLNDQSILEIEVQVSTRSDTERTFNVVVDDSDTEVSMENYSVGSIIVPPNSFTGVLTITGIDSDKLLTEPLPLTLRVDETAEDVSSDASIVVNMFKFCPFDAQLTDVTIDVFAFGSIAPSHTPSVTQVSDLEFDLSSSWGPSFVAWATGSPGFDGQFVYSGTLSINSCTNVATFTGNDSWATGGTGTYDPTTGEVSLTLTQDLFTTPFTVDIVIRPN